MNINERLKELRKNANLTQMELAERLGVSTNTYQSYELGKLGLTKGKLVKVCKIFDLTIEEFFGSEIKNETIKKVRELKRKLFYGHRFTEKEFYFMKDNTEYFQGLKFRKGKGK